MLYASLELFGVSGFEIVIWLRGPISTYKKKKETGLNISLYLRVDPIRSGMATMIDQSLIIDFVCKVMF